MNRENILEQLNLSLQSLNEEREAKLMAFREGDFREDTVIKQLSIKISRVEYCISNVDNLTFALVDDVLTVKHAGRKVNFRPDYDESSNRWFVKKVSAEDTTFYTIPCFYDPDMKEDSNYMAISRHVDYFNENNIAPKVCEDCGTFFALSAGESRYFRIKRYRLPKRCISCRRNRKNNKGANTHVIQEEQAELS